MSKENNAGRTCWCAIAGIAEEMATHPENPWTKAEWLVDIVKKHDL